MGRYRIELDHINYAVSEKEDRATTIFLQIVGKGGLGGPGGPCDLGDPGDSGDLGGPGGSDGPGGPGGQPSLYAFRKYIVFMV